MFLVVKFALSVCYARIIWVSVCMPYSIEWFPMWYFAVQFSCFFSKETQVVPLSNSFPLQPFCQLHRLSDKLENIEMMCGYTCCLF